MTFYQDYEDGIKERSVKKNDHEWNVNSSEISERFPTDQKTVWENGNFPHIAKIIQHVNKNGKNIILYTLMSMQKDVLFCVNL